MPLAEQTLHLLHLPPEIRLKIYEFAFPCLNDKEDYCNPILSRRLGNPKSFVCYKCEGRVYLRVCRQTRREVSPILFGAHEFRFQLWAEHKQALEDWFQAMSEHSIGDMRRFRLHTQYPDESLDLARTPGTATAMPGYIAIDLDAPSEFQMAVSSRTWTQTLLEPPRQQIVQLVKDLPRVEGRLRLSRQALLQIVGIVGWFGTRNKRERQMLEQQTTASRWSRS